MLRHLLLIAALVLTCINLHAETYYYTLEKIVTNKTPRSASGSGIFITFTNDGCYDSDKQGYTNNNSYLKFAYKGNYTIYHGRTYWGPGDYKFSSDLSRLNVVAGDKVYVYSRTTPSGSVSKSTYVGSPANSGGGSAPGYTVPGTPTNPNQSNGGGNKMSLQYYQETYSRYANLAESIYNSITTKLVDRNGNETRGYVYRSQDSQVAIQGMISNLRNVQRDMRKVREDARRDGYNIAVSRYENIDVKTY